MAIILSPKTGDRGPKEHALTYAALGWRVFPVHEMTREGVCSCAEGAACGKRSGKHPRTDGGVNEASNDRATVEGWWTRWPAASVGIATGRTSGLTVIDADVSEGKPGLVNLTVMAAKNGGIPGTLIANTGGGGLHLYFKYTEALRTGANVLATAIDVRNDGGYVIAPPSNHASGGAYKWAKESGELLEVPAWLLQGAVTGEEEGDKKKRGRKRSKPGFKLERVESMLTVIDPDDRDRWLALGVIIGRLYVGSGLESDAWAVYETWAARSAKFAEDKAGNVARMREMFYDRSQGSARAGGTQLSVGSLISWAKEADWSPFGDRTCVKFENGNESEMCAELSAALVERSENNHFNVMGEIRDVLKTQLPIVRMLQSAAERGEAAPETLVVRRTSVSGLLSSMSECAVLETSDAHGVPSAVPIPERLANMVLKQHANRFPTLSGVAEWPMVGADGALIVKQHGYDPVTGLYFDIASDVKVNERMSAEEALSWMSEELLTDFPFEEEEDGAAALGLVLAFMQRPLMKTCPAYAVVAPQPLTGKSTLIEVASLAVHGGPIASHAFSSDEEELRKAIHSLLLAKIPAVLFDNIGRGRTVDSDHLAKLLTSETSTDRTLGSSDTKKEVNTLLVTFTGNNIVFAHDMSSRVITIRLNAKTANPMQRAFKHRDVRAFAGEHRNKTLSACVAILRAGIAFKMPESTPSRFEDFDQRIVRPVLAVTQTDIRTRLNVEVDSDSEEEADLRSALEVLARWQHGWRKEENGKPWRVADLLTAIDSKVFDEATTLKILKRAAGEAKTFDADPGRVFGRMLRLLNGDHKFAPLVLRSHLDTKHKVNKWLVDGAEAFVAKSKGTAGEF
jgi:hypothetical protein